MKLSRQCRVITALIALIGVLFTQLAVAAYVCPNVQFKVANAAHAMASPGKSHHMPGCGMTDMVYPALCHAHAHAGAQSLDVPQLPHVSPFMILTLQAIVIDGAELQRAIEVSVPPLILARSTAPPLSIQHCCFRI